MDMRIREEVEEIEKWIEGNSLAKALIKKSKLKKEELKALMVYFTVEDVTFEDLASEMDINRSGAWKRYKKGFEKIIQSFYTVELAAYSGVLDPKVTEMLAEDLTDYVRLLQGEGDIEAIRARLEKRMAVMEELEP